MRHHALFAGMSGQRLRFTPTMRFLAFLFALCPMLSAFAAKPNIILIYTDDHGHADVQLVVTGGYRTPDEMAKAMALGADAVALATASMMAIGCQQYRACHRGTCPVGIATQDPVLRSRLDPAVSAERLTRFLLAATEMMTDYARITGRRSLGELAREDLAALRPDAAALLDIDVRA